MKYVLMLAIVLNSYIAHAQQVHMKCDVSVKIRYPVSSIKNDVDEKDEATLSIYSDKDGIAVVGETSIAKSNQKIYATTINVGMHEILNLSTNSNITIHMSPKNKNWGHEDVVLKLNRISGDLKYSSTSRARDLEIVGTCKKVDAIF